jgi:putative SOS response-associated peptidase YedK
MCGRFAFISESNEILSGLTDKANQRLAREWEYDDHELFVDPQQIKTGEVSPTNTILTLISDGVENVGAFGTRWGIETNFGGKKGQLINARSETVLDKVTFKNLFLRQRCVIPTTGFYEWQHLNGIAKKGEKFYFTVSKIEPLYLAGLFKRADGINLSVIMTTAPNASMIDVHDRMPLIIPQNLIRDWLNDETFARDYLSAKMPLLTKEPA